MRAVSVLSVEPGSLFGESSYRKTELVGLQRSDGVGKCLHMNDDLYPRITIRLSPMMRRRVSIAAYKRHVSQGQVVREALSSYLLGRTSLDDSANTDTR